MLNLAVVGAGFMGSLHARAIAECPVTKLKAVVDRDSALAKRIAAPYGAEAYPDVNTALHKRNIDGFVVALPDRAHVEVSVALLEAGKAVLLEKPLAHSLEAARTIVAAEAAGGGRLMVGHILRFDPRYVQAARAVEAGMIGQPIHSKAGRVATRSIGERMNGKSSVLFYLGIHDVDALQWVTGQSITRVYSRSVSRLMPILGVSSEDAILSVVDFADGSVGQLFNGWTRPANSPIEIDGRLEVFGTDGVVEIDVRDHGCRILTPDGYSLPDGLHWPEVNGLIAGDLAAEVAHFGTAVLDDRPFMMEVEEAVRAVAVNDAILRSLESGLPEAVAS